MVSVSEALHWVDIHKFAFFIEDIHTINRHMWYTCDFWKVKWLIYVWDMKSHFSYPRHISVIFFNVLHTQITFCIVRETSTLCFLFICETLTWHTFSTCDGGLTVPEDLFISQDTCTIDQKDFSVSKANQYTCLTFCTFDIHTDFLWQTSQTDFLIRQTQEQHNLYPTHPSSKSWTMTNLCLGSLTSRPDKREVASSDKVRGNLTCWSKISSNKMSWSRL